ncbi:septum formation protein Maf [Haematospirillum jordaniae]|uniref:Maf family protein n=1 Tax=Haematospirillum jordaniae TaxID=1549855 RepID=UPI0014328DE7|nr:Maf family protein [Haematospirillum jordaniae]NKD86073.1 septum formation protein Maf [Haematospirillum jordaniae]
MSQPGLVLASGSMIRRRILSDAGIPFHVDIPNVDEGALKKACRNDGLTVEQTALELACAKALQVSVRYPETLVLGADQILECHGDWFDKPRDYQQAKNQLLILSGKTHRLVSGVALCMNGRVMWKMADNSFMTMRSLCEKRVENYLDKAGDKALASVGSYQVEALGVHLFEQMEGNWFTILGLPLLPVLDVLRQHGIVDP